MIETAVTETSGGGAVAVARQPRPRVLFIDDLAARLGCSRKTIERRLKAGTFPIRPLPNIDNRTRWSADDVEAYERGRLPR